MKKKILITGVAGFIGSSIAKRLIEEDFQVFGIDDLSSGKLSSVPKKVEFIKQDLSNRKLFQPIPRECKIILHLAGQSSGEISFENPQRDLEKNTVSTINLIEQGIQNNVEKIVYASSMSVYGNYKTRISENMKLNPISCYGVGKLASENYLRIFSKRLPFIIFRMFNVYGPGQDMENLKQGMMSIYLSQAIKKKKIIVKGSHKRKRDFIFIDDVVDIWHESIFNKNAINQTFNLGSGKAISVQKLLEQILTYFPDCKIKYVKGTPGDQFSVCSNNNLLKRKFKFKNFTSLNSGLKKFIESFD